MIDLALDALSWACIIAGGGLSLIGAIGILRLPDVFARMHGASMIDTLGMALLLLGLMFQAGLSLVTVKLILIVAFVLFTSPTATHALARAALLAGVQPRLAARRQADATPEGRDAPSKP